MTSTTAVVLIVLIVATVIGGVITAVILTAIKGFVEVKRLDTTAKYRSEANTTASYQPLERLSPFDPPPSNVNIRNG